MSLIDWHEARAHVVGGSEIAALFDVEDDGAGFISHRELWETKRGTMPPKPFKEPMRWGVRMEAVIVEAVREELGLNVFSWNSSDLELSAITLPPGVALHQTTKGAMLTHECGLGGNPDGLLVAPDGQIEGVEIKNISSFALRTLWPDGGETLKPSYELQCRAYMELTGFRRWHVFGLVDGCKLRQWTVEHDATIGAGLIASVRKFWQSIAANEPPPWSIARDGDAIKRLWNATDAAGTESRDGDATFVALLDEYTSARAERLAAEKREESAETRLRLAIGELESITADGWTVTAKKSKPTPGKLITADMVGTLIGAREGSRRLTVKPPKD